MREIRVYINIHKDYNYSVAIKQGRIEELFDYISNHEWIWYDNINHQIQIQRNDGTEVNEFI